MRISKNILLAAVLLALPVATRAQLQSVIEKFERGPHTGPVDDALVGLYVEPLGGEGSSAGAVRVGNGLLIRCDGFILAPSAMFQDKDGQPFASVRVTVFIHPGRPKPTIVAGRKPRYIARGIGYTIFKIDDVHLPALKIVTSDACKPGDVVEVAYFGWDENGAFSQPIRRVPAPIGVSAKDLPPGAIAFSDTLPNIAPGAAVLDKSGRAIGIVPGMSPATPRSHFISFSMLNRVTNCVTAAPPDSNGDAGMVEVPGGPIRMPVAVLANQPDMERATTACVAPFKIDKLEVTNGQYLAFWNGLSDEDRKKLHEKLYPAGWSNFSPPFPAEIENLPVIGVRLDGAEAYAAWAGKRLPTPYEWCLAAFGPKGMTAPPDWVNRYVKDRKDAWKRIHSKHMELLAQHPELRGDDFLDVEPRHIAIPIINIPPTLNSIAAQSKEAIEGELDNVWNDWKDPPCLLPVGSRPFDTSPYGAQDMVMNAAELAQPFPGAVGGRDPRYLEVTWRQDIDIPPFIICYPARHLLNVVTEIMDRSGKGNVDALPPLSRLYRRAFASPRQEFLLAAESIAEAQSLMRPVSGWDLAYQPVDAKHEARQLLWNDGDKSVFLHPNHNEGAALYIVDPSRIGINDPMNPYFRAAGYRVWAQQPKHFRIEMGRPVAIDFTDDPGASGDAQDRATGKFAELYYLRTMGGFRCAK